MKKFFALLLAFSFTQVVLAQSKTGKKKETQPLVTLANTSEADSGIKTLKWRNIGPFRGGRSVTASGVVKDPLIYYMGTTGGGLWKTFDAGGTWQNISDGYFKTGSVGSVAVSESDPNVVYVGMGEHPPRGVMTSYGDGVYKSTDAGKSWKKMGLDLTRQIAMIRIHPNDPDIVYVAAQGAIHGSSTERGIYKSTDGGTNWKKILYVDENTGCADLSMDMNNPRILYAAMWDYRRTPWEIRSGGKGSGLYKSTDAGETWTKMEKGLPKEKGKMAIEVSRSNPEKVYALVESDSQKELGGLFTSEDAGKTWSLVSKDHRLVQRAWYYIELAVDPLNENVLYVLNAPALRSIDGGKTWSQVRGTHGDFHQLWINPANSKNMIVANDGGAAISFNSAKTWSTQNNQPTAQFYRVNADNLFPYNVYGGQQDNSSVKIASRTFTGSSIGDKDWFPSAGGESAFIAFDPNDPRYLMGGSYQGTIELLDQQTQEGKSIMVSPVQYLAMKPKDMKYRFNWNAPIINSPNNTSVFYHAGNILFKTEDRGINWTAISPDLTRHDTSKMGFSGVPYTNEGAGGENYGTISYVAESPIEKGVIWTGSDDGLVHVTRDDGKTWVNVTPAVLGETLINSIELSPHQKGVAYIATTKYKMNDLSPAIYKTTDYGKTWSNISSGIPYGAYTRVVREDDERKDLLYAGTETGFYLSYNGGRTWKQQQLNLPVTPITDLKVHKGNLIAATMGRAFWILDDITIFRQYNKTDSTKRLELFKPTDTYRVSGASVLDQPDAEEDAPAPVYTTGTNAPTGVSVYYMVPARPDSIKLTMEIGDAKGNLIRSYTSQPNKNFVRYAGGPEPEPLLPNKPGLNRFTWDMRYSTLPGVQNIFVEGSFRGRRVSPGKYFIKLKTDKEERFTEVNILKDPRINADINDYSRQEQTLAEIDNKIKDIHQSVTQMRLVRTQINDLIQLLTDTIKYKAVIDEGKKLVKKITNWEEKLVQPKAKSYDDVINFENKLSANYIFLKNEMESNLPSVTNGQQQRLNELNDFWKPIQNDYNTLKQDVAAFNLMCKNYNIDKITIPDLPK